MSCSRLSPRGITLPELLITMAVFSLLLMMSGTVVTRYYHAYRLMDSSLPSERSLAHNLDFLMRELSKAQIVYEPSSKLLKDGFVPSWSEGETHQLLRLKLVDSNKKQTFCTLGYSQKDEGLLLLEYPVEDEKLGEPRKQILKTGPLTLRAVPTGRQTLFHLSLAPTASGKLPIQTAITLKDLSYESLDSKKRGKRA